MSGRPITDSAARLAERASAEAELLRLRRGRNRPDRIAAQPRTGRPQRFPATPEQKSLWLQDQLDPWPGARHIPDAVRVRGPLRPELLELAVGDLVTRHESLRTTFELVGDQLWQVVQPRLPVPLEVIETTEDQYVQLVSELGSKPFDLSTGPLLRSVLLRSGPEDSVLLMAVHHIISDGQSSEILISELTECYLARAQGRSAALPPMEIQLADYAVWRRQQLTGPRREQLTQYWQARLAGLPATRLPADLPPPSRRAWTAGNLVRALPADLADRVSRFAVKRRTTEFVVYLAAFHSTLAALSGDRDFAVQVPVLGRSRPETEQVIGCFRNALLIRAELAGQPSFGETVDRLAEQFVQDMAHGDLPLGEQQAMVEPPLGADGPPAGSHLVQVVFAVDPDMVPSADGSGLSFELVPYLLPYALRELHLAVLHSGPDALVVIRYADERYSPARIEELFQRYCAVLEAGLADPDSCLLGEPGQPAVPIVDERPVAPTEPEPRPVPADWLAEAIRAWVAAVRRCRPGQAVDPGSLTATSRLFDSGDRLTVAAFARALTDDCGFPVAARDVLAAGTLGEVAQLLAGQADRSSTGEPAGPGRCVHQLVRRQAERSPDAIAVSFGGQELSYRELVARADQLAAGLRKAGVTREQVVAVVAERSAELVVRLLGVLSASAAYLALDPELPAARREQLLAAAGCRIVLGAPADLPLPAGVRALADADPELAETAPEPAASEFDVADQLAYVSFTSGSTGIPKGVCVPHAAIARLVLGPDWCEFGPDDVFLQLAPVAFDASTLEIWAPLCNGGRLAVMPPGSLDLAELAATIESERVTVLWLTAGLFGRFADRYPMAFGHVRQLISGGDVVPPATVRRLLQAWPGLRFTNGYGPTENTTFTTCWSTQEPPAGTEPLPIGRPISGTEVRLLDDDLRAVAAGEVGQLAAAGAGLARGYLGQPAATADRFRPDPVGPPGSRLYLTGDLARWDEGGDLQFLGRADRQLKLRGYRIEPGEVEAALLDVPGVAQALVRLEDDGEQRLSGYLTVVAATPETDSDQPGPLVHAGLPGAAIAKAVRRRLADRMPAYLVPGSITVLAEFPLTSNGKVDLDRLAQATRHEPPQAELADRQPTVAEPATEQPDADPDLDPRMAELCAGLSELWAQHLRVERVGQHDDFFELGGHSLIAAELLEAVQRRYSVFIPGRTLYLNPTVRELALEIVLEMNRIAGAEGAMAEPV